MPFSDFDPANITWRPGIGDPTFGGWFTVLCYVVATYLCWRRARADRYRHAWLALSVVLAALAINKQLDLQSLFTDVGREIARVQGWYDSRRQVQKLFVLGIAAATALSMLLLAYLSHRHPVGSLRLALLGLCFLGGFIVVRAASFHHFDRFIDLRVAGLRMNWVLEVGGIAIIALAALARPHIEDSRSPPAA